jgi:diguanylate cyclase (GGDEF)-like protein
MALAPDKVQQLTALINQAEDNGEEHDFIQNQLIPQFKAKYDTPTPEVPTPAAPVPKEDNSLFGHWGQTITRNEAESKAEEKNPQINRVQHTVRNINRGFQDAFDPIGTVAGDVAKTFGISQGLDALSKTPAIAPYVKNYQENTEEEQRTNSIVPDVENLAVNALSMVPVGRFAGEAKKAAGLGEITDVTKSAEKYKKVSRDVVGPGIGPKVFNNAKQSRDFHNKTHDAGLVIANDRESVNFFDKNGEIVSDRPPETLAETAQAIEKVKKTEYEKSHAKAVGAGDAGVQFDTFNANSKLDQLAESKIDDIRNAAIKAKEQLGKFENAKPEEVEEYIKYLNKSLAPYFQSGVGTAEQQVNGSLTKILREDLDNQITDAMGPGYQEGKNRYGALKHIEREVEKRADVLARRSPTGGLLGMTDLFSGELILGGIFLHNPEMVVRGGILKGLKEIQKGLNDPNRYVKRWMKAAYEHDDLLKKGGADAEAIRGNAGPVQGRGDVGQGGKNEGGQDIQLDEETGGGVTPPPQKPQGPAGGAGVQPAEGPVKPGPDVPTNPPAPEAPRSSSGHFTEEELNAMPPEQAQRIRDIQKDAMESGVDQGTGISNRWGAIRAAEAAGLDIDKVKTLSTDIDNFKKKVNDAHGHPVGDEVLKAKAEILQKHFSNIPGAIVARTGGEEFNVFFLKPVDDNVILKITEAANRELASMPFNGGKLTGVTFSSGLAETWKLSDKQLYLAKGSNKAHTRYKGEYYGHVRTRAGQLPKNEHEDELRVQPGGRNAAGAGSPAQTPTPEAGGGASPEAQGAAAKQGPAPGNVSPGVGKRAAETQDAADVNLTNYPSSEEELYHGWADNNPTEYDKVFDPEIPEVDLSNAPPEVKTAILDYQEARRASIDAEERMATLENAKEELSDLNKIKTKSSSKEVVKGAKEKQFEDLRAKFTPDEQAVFDNFANNMHIDPEFMTADEVNSVLQKIEDRKTLLNGIVSGVKKKDFSIRGTGETIADASKKVREEPPAPAPAKAPAETTGPSLESLADEFVKDRNITSSNINSFVKKFRNITDNTSRSEAYKALADAFKKKVRAK